jgi:hypothetical protein
MDAATETRVHPVSKNEVGTEVSAHDLLNEATEWLQYSRGIADLLAELIHEADSVDCGRMALGLEAISALTRLGLQCAAHAHAQVSWEKTRRE